MFEGPRNWFRRNRANLAVGAGVLAGGYLAGQYVLGKITEARQRMSEERISKENLRRRFEQNQEDCTYTVLAILHKATENIVEALPVEETLAELQKQRAERLARSGGASGAISEVSTTDLPSVTPSITEIDGKSLTSLGESESFVHTSQIAQSEGGLGEPKPKRSKAQLWNEVKINSIARAFTLIYTLALLNLFTRIQLNLLGRRNYLASVVSLASPPSSRDRDGSHQIFLENRDDDNFENAYGNDYETNRKYLSFSWWLLNRGCRDILEKVLTAVTEVFGPLNPREDLSLEKLSELTVEVRKRVEGATEQDRRTTKYLPYLLPPAEQEVSVLRQVIPSASPPTSPSLTTADVSQSQTQSELAIPTTLRRLLDESSDLVDSPSFHQVLTLLLDSAFSLLIDQKIAHLAYKIPPTSASSSRVQELVDPKTAKAKVANTLAVFCRQAHVIGSGGSTGITSGVGLAGPVGGGLPGVGGNEYLAAMEQVRDLEAFAAVVYSSNFEFEAPEAGIGSSAYEATASIPAGNVLLNQSRPVGSVMWAEGDESAKGQAGRQAAPTAAGNVENSGFDAAWEKALRKEDGRSYGHG